MINWFMFLGCLLFGHRFSDLRVTVTSSGITYKECVCCEKRVEVRNDKSTGN